MKYLVFWLFCFDGYKMRSVVKGGVSNEPGNFLQFVNFANGDRGIACLIAAYALNMGMVTAQQDVDSACCQKKI